MMTKLVGILAICYVTTGWCVTPTYAFPVTWEFTGTVDTFDDFTNIFGGAVSVGTLITGQFTFESTTPDIFPDDVDLGVYSAITSLTGFLGDTPFRSLDTESIIRVINNLKSGNSVHDTFNTVSSINFQDIQDNDGQEMKILFSLVFVDTDGTMFTSDSLPLHPIDVDLLAWSAFFTNNNQVSITGRITSVVPEPTTLTLFAIGTFACLKRRRAAANYSSWVHLRQTHATRQ